MELTEARTDTSATPTTELDLVTVVIPAHNEEDHIARCLETIQRQTYRQTEIIVVDGASTDRTADVVEVLRHADSRIRLVDNDQKLIPVSLNRAVDAARGRWLVRVDAHAGIPDDYVANAVRLLRSGQWGGVGGRKDGLGDTAWGRAIAAAMSSPVGVGNSYYHYGTEAREVDHVPFGAYPLDVIRELGGWDPQLAVNQDFEFDHRVRESGRPILFDPALRIEWQSRQTIPALYRQYRRYGQGKFTVIRKHPRSAKPRQLAGPALVAALIAGLALAVAGWPLPLVALAGTYGGLVLLGGLHQRFRSGVSALRTAAAFVAMHVGHGVGFWRGFLGAVVGSR